ncbi:MAG: cell wall hydrolase [Oscillospiraceae bacterium]|nr:cell wall hydrolase [Oscillospiraceae bacterium]
MGRRITGHIAALLLACAVVIAAAKAGQQAAKARSSTKPAQTVTTAVERENLSAHQAAIIEGLLEPLEGECGLSREDADLIAAIVYLEARGESAQGQQAIAEVIFNRLLSDDFPDTVQEIIFQEGQFASVALLDMAEPGPEQYAALLGALEGERVLPTNVLYFSVDGESKAVWGQIGGHIFCYG